MINHDLYFRNSIKISSNNLTRNLKIGKSFKIFKVSFKLLIIKIHQIVFTLEPPKVNNYKCVTHISIFKIQLKYLLLILYKIQLYRIYVKFQKVHELLIIKIHQAVSTL